MSPLGRSVEAANRNQGSRRSLDICMGAGCIVVQSLAVRTKQAFSTPLEGAQRQGPQGEIVMPAGPAVICMGIRSISSQSTTEAGELVQYSRRIFSIHVGGDDRNLKLLDHSFGTQTFAWKRAGKERCRRG